MWAQAAPSGHLNVGVDRAPRMWARTDGTLRARCSGVADSGLRFCEPNLEAGLSLAKGGAKA